MKVEFRYGQKVQQLREERAWTQEHLAAIADVEVRTIQRVEKGQTKHPETLQAIAAAFDLTVDALRTRWRVAESRLLRTWLVTTYRQFLAVQEAHTWDMGCPCVVAPLAEEGRTQVDELLTKILEDRDCIDPSDADLWNTYIRYIKEPLQSLFELGLTIFVLDEQRDLLLRALGENKPSQDHMEVRMQRILVIPRYGCFRLSTTEPLHRFNESCVAAGDTLFRAAEKSLGLHVHSNALSAITQAGGEDGVRWCNTCFPPLPGGARISFEYIEQVTGLKRHQLHALCDAITGQPFIEGLA